MKSLRAAAAPYLLLAAGFVFHAAFDARLQVGPARPNTALTVLFLLALRAGAARAAGLGFFAGLLEASLTARFVGSIIVSRTLAAFLAGASERRLFRDSPVAGAAIVAGCTAAAELLFFLFAPEWPAGRWLVRTVGETACNGLIAVCLGTMAGLIRGRNRAQAGPKLFQMNR